MKKWLKNIGVAIGLVVVMVAVQFLPVQQWIGSATSIGRQDTNSVGFGDKASLTIGFVGTAYAVAPDYTVDGTDDNVQVQQALNALPTTGGRIVLYAGNYDFGATVTRAINNVTIEGDGKGTYITNNAATALFSVGSQTGWIFRDFRTDAGYLTLYADTLVERVWNNATLVDYSSRADTTRTVNLYVAGNGNDSSNGLSTATPKLTIQAAVNLVPDNFAANYIINIASGTYAGTVSAFDKHPIGNVNLTLQGYQNTAANQFTHTQSVAGTSSGAAGAGNFPTAKPYLLDATKNFAAYKGNAYVLHLTGGTGYSATIEQNNWYAIASSAEDAGNTHLPIVGSWTGTTPDVTTTYEVIPMDQCTITAQMVFQDSANIRVRNIGFVEGGKLSFMSVHGTSIFPSSSNTADKNLVIAAYSTCVGVIAYYIPFAMYTDSSVAWIATRVKGNAQVFNGLVAYDGNMVSGRSVYVDNTTNNSVVFAGPGYFAVNDLMVSYSAFYGVTVEGSWADALHGWYIHNSTQAGIYLSSPGSRIVFMNDSVVSFNGASGVIVEVGANLWCMGATVVFNNNTGYGTITRYNGVTSYGSLATYAANTVGAHSEATGGQWY